MKRREFIATLATTSAGLVILPRMSLFGSEPPTYPPAPEQATWLEKHQRFSFNMSEDLLDAAVRDGVNVVCGGTNAAGESLGGGPWAIDTQGNIVDVYTGKIVPEEVLEKSRKTVNLAQAKGFKVVSPQMRMWNNKVLLEEHPEWQELTSPAAKPLSPPEKKFTDWPPLTGCWNSPFGDLAIRASATLAKRLDVDGISLDGFGCWTRCYCAACREAYKQDTGKEIPSVTTQSEGKPGVPAADTVDLNNPDYRYYLKWRLRRFTKFTERWQKGLKAVKKEMAFMPWSSGPGRWWHWTFSPLVECSDAANRLLDAAFLELFWDFPPNQASNLLPSFTVRYYRGLMGDRPPYMLSYFCTQGQYWVQPPVIENQFRMLTAITNGAYTATGGLAMTGVNEPQKIYFDLIKEREPWTTGTRSLKWAAMLVGESSRLMYGIPGQRSETPLGRWIGSGVDTPDVSKLPASERRLPAHMESAAGFFRAAMEEHLPLDIITEQDVEEGKGLSQYKVLILPNAACISEAGLNNIKKFVEAGGGLVALHESSLYDEYATKRADFGLADLFGAQFKGFKDYTARWPNYPDYTNLALVKHKITTDPVIQACFRHDTPNYLNYIGITAEVEVNPGTQIVAWQGKEAQKALTTGKPEADLWPFLLLNERGKGRVAYFAGDPAQAYFLAPYTYERRLLTNALRWAAGDAQPPVEVQAPLCVQAAFYEQHGGKRLIVHLLNEINTSAGRALPEGDPPVREEIIPLTGITLSTKGRWVKAMLQPEGQALKIESSAGVTRIHVPQLKLHSMVVLET
jgi:hypothetical protein